jgi:serine protease
MVKVIIGFKDGTTSRMAEQPGVEVSHQFTRANAEAVRMSRNDLMSLSDNPDIAFVEEDGVDYLNTETIPWGIPAIQADVTTTPPPDTVNLRPGEGCFHICVVDSGFYAGHEDLVSLSCLKMKNDSRILTHVLDLPVVRCSRFLPPPIAALFNPVGKYSWR